MDFWFNSRKVPDGEPTVNALCGISWRETDLRALVSDVDLRPKIQRSRIVSSGHEYRFTIDGLAPDTLPMARLAEYMADLATVLGEPKSVHFVGIEEGSVVLVQKIDDDAISTVRERVDQVRRGEGPWDAMRAYRQTNKRLKQDNCTGLLSEDGDAEIIQFPGRDEDEPISFGAFNQDGTLDGKVIVIGGKGDPVPVHLQLGDVTFNCHANRDVAKALGGYLFNHELRVRGSGRWLREDDGTWTMQRFTIASFEVLDEQPLSGVVARLRDIPGSGWKDVADPWAELIDIRGGPDKAR